MALNKFTEGRISVSSQMVDCVNNEEVEVRISVDGRLWVNVDGICRLRAYKAKQIIIEDERQITNEPNTGQD